MNSFGADGLAWNAGVGIVGPLFQFNKNKRRVQVEREKTQQALLLYERSILNAFSEVENALQSVNTLTKELEARDEQQIAALSSERLSFERYNKGVTSYLEVLDSQRAAFEAELIYTQTYQDLLSAYVNLYKVLGGGWLNKEEESSAAEAAE